jgi:hypothetical protein
MSETDNGIVRIPSRHTVAETMERLQALLKEPGTPLMVESPVAGLDLPLKRSPGRMRRARPGSLTTIRRTSCVAIASPRRSAPISRPPRPWWRSRQASKSDYTSSPPIFTT